MTPCRLLASLIACSFAALLHAAPVAAQDLPRDLAAFVETPAVPGYEQALAAVIRARLKNLPVKNDNLGNLHVTLGSGTPHRLIVAPMDEPGYVVSGITADGFLRVQRLPQTAPHPLFDLLHAAQPIVIHTRTDKWAPGVVAGLSTHLQPGRLNAPRVTHPDEMYIDIGAVSPADVRQAGVDLLDPLALERKLYDLGFGRLAGMAVGDRFGCAALVELLRWTDASKLRGTLTVAFVAQQWVGSRGFDRLLEHIAADEVIYVGRLLPQRPIGGLEGMAPPRQPRWAPGNGASIGTTDPEAPLTGLALELRQLGEANKINVAADFSAPLPRVRYTQGPALPQRFVHLAIPTKFPTTPAEVIQISDLKNLASLLELYAQGSARPSEPSGYADGLRSGPYRPQTAPPVTKILKELVETYGVSGHEAPVREAIQRLLPAWAKPETDPAGNLILHIGSPAQGVKRIAFVAHMDEIGYVVRRIAEDGNLEVQSRGGGMPEFFAGHAVLVHTNSGARPGVLALVPGWDAPGFTFPRGQAGEATSRVETGARNASEVQQLGIQAGDSITVPKKYRKLFGTRANGRSFDDRVGCAALAAAVWAIGPALTGRDVTFIWSTEEEVGLRGAHAAARQLAREGRAPDYVFAVDTFVSADSPLESPRFAGARVGQGFVVRAVDNSNIAPRELVDRVVALARTNKIPAQYGVTGGGNDGAVFLRYGSMDIPLGWALRYSHSPGEVIDTRDLDALARIVAAIARSW